MTKKILIINCENPICWLVESVLIKEGYEIFKASGKEEAFSKLHEVSPDILILNMSVLKKNMYEVYERLRYDENYKNLPTLILKSNGKEDSKESLNPETNEYLVRPFILDDFLVKVKAMLNVVNKEDLVSSCR